jgi:hypothetical protein
MGRKRGAVAKAAAPGATKPEKLKGAELMAAIKGAIVTYHEQAPRAKELDKRYGALRRGMKKRLRSCEAELARLAYNGDGCFEARTHVPQRAVETKKARRSREQRESEALREEERAAQEAKLNADRHAFFDAFHGLYGSVAGAAAPHSASASEPASSRKRKHGEAFPPASEKRGSQKKAGAEERRRIDAALESWLARTPHTGEGALLMQPWILNHQAPAPVATDGEAVLERRLRLKKVPAKQSVVVDDGDGDVEAAKERKRKHKFVDEASLRVMLQAAQGTIRDHHDEATPEASLMGDINVLLRDMFNTPDLRAEVDAAAHGTVTAEAEPAWDHERVKVSLVRLKKAPVPGTKRFTEAAKVEAERVAALPLYAYDPVLLRWLQAREEDTSVRAAIKEVAMRPTAEALGKAVPLLERYTRDVPEGDVERRGKASVRTRNARINGATYRVERIERDAPSVAELAEKWRKAGGLPRRSFASMLKKHPLDLSVPECLALTPELLLKAYTDRLLDVVSEAAQDANRTSYTVTIVSVDAESLLRGGGADTASTDGGGGGGSAMDTTTA